VAVDNEIYNRFADTWWDEDGMLHILKTSLNPARFGYFRRVLTERLRVPIEGKAVLDVGCGGGILAEEFARLGCAVTGVDPSQPSLEVARRHAEREGLDISYRLGTGEHLPVADASFEIVYCCDVLEHVDDVHGVIAEIGRALKPGGVFLYDTINRTVASKLVVIKLMQEWEWSSFVPPHLHDWDRFIKPQELEAIMRLKGLEPQEFVGLVPAENPLRMIKAMRDRKKGRIAYGEFGRRVRVKDGTNTSISYMGYAVKRTDMSRRESE
jgi:2-polyprenyl-6-hydroxyphenyl methylase / 3-demethylubiquinone-9 3-methyltransferase